MKQFKMLLLTSMLILFTACGGGSSSNDGNQPLNPVVDTTAPVITILGNNPETIIQNTVYNDEGAIAVDDRDGTISISTTGSVDTSTIGVYTLHYSATDSASNTATKTRTVFVNEFFQANIYIIAEAGINQNIHTASTVTLDGSTSTSVEGNLLSYKWTIINSPGDKAVLSNESIVNPTFVADVEGRYLIQLTVKDEVGNSSSDTVVITATTGNAAPIAYAGANQNISKTSIVTLDGSRSSDTDHDELTYQWNFVNKPNGSKARLSNEKIVNPTFIADTEGTYLIQLIVNDGTSNSSSDTVIITATIGNAAPVAHAGANQNINTTSIVTLDGSISLDTDHDELTYQWNFVSKPNGSNAILSSETDVHPTFVADVSGSYVIQLIVNDGTVDSMSVTTTITANTANSVPVVKSIIYRDPVTLFYTGDHIYLVADASDANHDALTYHWSFLSRPAASTAKRIFNSNGLTANGDFYPDAPGTYVLQVKANDGHVDSNQVQITIHINNIARWGTATLVETSTGNARFPQIAMDARGNAMMVWQQDDGNSINIVARRYVPTTGWRAKEVIDSSREDASVPQIAMSPNGNAMSVWVQDNDILANSYLTDEGWGGAEVIDSNSENANSPQIDIDANGNAIAVWQQTIDNGVNDGENSDIQSNYYMAGSGWDTVQNLDCFCRHEYSSRPQIAMDAYGNAIAVWNTYNDEYYINGTRYVNNSGWIDSIFPGENGGYNPQITMNDNGNAMLVWYQRDRAGDNIYAGHYVSGSGWSATEMVGSGYTPQISMNDNDNAIAIWQDFGDILVSHYTPASGWSTVQTIGNGKNSMQIAMNNNGDAIAVWISDNKKKNLLANRYLVGIGWGSAEVIDNGNGEVNMPQIAMDDNGDAMVVWYQLDGSYFSIYSNRFE